ncbi:MAG TPA: N-acetylneuraminate synthase family protein [Magnetospirillum sp.]|jgi:sialic acid synthase SpsE/spore coat polysaccharide biosynthesis protein SpsF (cytidylyltransferase family)|nr:N-acetylneuraminate synthase family protein [Magnetospirillum sp.]
MTALVSQAGRGGIVGILQARMGSTRLPGKILMPLAGAPMLQRLVERLRRSCRLDHLVVATSDQPADDATAQLCRDIGVDCFRGSETDVLSRFLAVAGATGADLVVRLTGDNPFVDGPLVDQLIAEFEACVPALDYANNIDGSGYPYGLSLEIVSRKALEAAGASDDPQDREHVTRFVRNGGRFRGGVLKAKTAFAYDRLTVDTADDYQKVRALFERLYAEQPDFSLPALSLEAPMQVSTFSIAGREIGPGRAPYLIAEAGINHDGNPEQAMALVEAAARSGADALKLQVFETGKFLALSSAYFDIFRERELSNSVITAMIRRAEELGLTVFSSVFDEGSADMLAEMGTPAFKIASGDLTHLPLLRHIARHGRPIILSTGCATLDEIGEAIAAIREVNAQLPVAVLHCVSNYPTNPSQANLACMRSIAERFGVVVGYSDHTQGIAVPIAAVALGATIIEKHFTLDRNLPGPDHALSADPQEFAAMAAAARDAAASVGSAVKAPVEEASFIPLIRRSIVAAVDLPAGTVVEAAMLGFKRPGTGIAPRELERLVGRRTSRAFAADEALAWDGLGD